MYDHICTCCYDRIFFNAIERNCAGISPPHFRELCKPDDQAEFPDVLFMNFDVLVGPSSAKQHERAQHVQPLASPPAARAPPAGPLPSLTPFNQRTSYAFLHLRQLSSVFLFVCLSFPLGMFTLEHTVSPRSLFLKRSEDLVLALEPPAVCAARYERGAQLLRLFTEAFQNCAACSRRR